MSDPQTRDQLRLRSQGLGSEIAAFVAQRRQLQPERQFAPRTSSFEVREETLHRFAAAKQEFDKYTTQMWKASYDSKAKVLLEDLAAAGYGDTKGELAALYKTEWAGPLMAEEIGQYLLRMAERLSR